MRMESPSPVKLFDGHPSLSKKVSFLNDDKEIVSIEDMDPDINLNESSLKIDQINEEVDEDTREEIRKSTES